MEALATDDFASLQLPEGGGCLQQLVHFDNKGKAGKPDQARAAKESAKAKPKRLAKLPATEGAQDFAAGKRQATAMSKAIMECMEWPTRLSVVEESNARKSVVEDMNVSLQRMQDAKMRLEKVCATKEVSSLDSAMEACQSAKRLFEQSAKFAKSLLPKAPKRQKCEGK